MNKKRIGTTYANCAIEAGKNTIVAHDTSVSRKKAITSHRSMGPPGRWTVSPVTFNSPALPVKPKPARGMRPLRFHTRNQRSRPQPRLDIEIGAGAYPPREDTP